VDYDDTNDGDTTAFTILRRHFVSPDGAVDAPIFLSGGCGDGALFALHKRVLNRK